MTLTRKRALELLHNHMKMTNLRRHCYAVEATMRALAGRVGEDEELWGLTGLLHDGDYEETRDTPEQHTLKMVEYIKAEIGGKLDKDDRQMIDAILSHNYERNGMREPQTKMEWALYTCDELTGFVVAAALVRPDRKLASVDINFLERKWKERSFAAGVHREQVMGCQDRLGMPIEEFMQITLEAMQEIAQELGL